LAKYPPHQIKIFDNLLDNFDEAYQVIVQAVEDWCDYKREIAFDVPNKLVPQLLSNQINHHYENKLVKVVGVVDVVGNWASYPNLFRFCCNGCGHIYHSIRKQTICPECNYKNKRAVKTFYISRKSFTLNQKDIANTVPAPCFYEVPTEFMEEALFKDSDILGNHVELLCVPQPILTPSQYSKQDVEWHLQVYGLKKHKFRVISKDRAKEIIEKVRDDSEAFKKLAMSMTKKTYGLEYLRMFSFASAVGLKEADEDIRGKNPAYNGLVVGDPSVGKSFTTKQLIEYFPLTQYAQGSSTSTVGLLGGVDKAKGGNFILRAGAVQQCDGGLLILDELDKMPQEQTRGLFTALSDGHHTITKVTGQHEFKYNTCFICIANPKHSKFDQGSELYSQIDLDSAYMSRMVWINIAKKPFLDKDGQIDPEKHKVHRAYVTGRLCYPQDYDEDFLKDYGVLVKQFKNAMLTDEIKILCENYFAEKNAIYKDKKKRDFKDVEIDTSNKSIDERMLSGLLILCKIIARATFQPKVLPEHFEIAKDMVENGMLVDMIGAGIESLEQFEYKMEKAQAKTVLKSRRDKFEFLKEKLPTKQTDMQEFIEEMMELTEWSESEIDRMLKQMHQEGYWFEPKPGFIMTQG
jgi:DNA replicative helicase MCM subunit Mcm2 (Cdc46/Mcm family)